MSLVQIQQIQATGKKYWRSLNELANTAEFRSWVEKEFPGGTDILEGDSRRNILKLMAASFGLAGMAACSRPVEKVMPMTKGVEDLIPGKPLYYNTVFSLSKNVIGITVESHDGRPTKVEGNPNHPLSRGKATGYAQASILNLYDPERTYQVTQGHRESSWEKWDKFVETDLSPERLGKGTGVRVVTETIVSPALMEVKKAFLARYQEAKWIEYDAVNDAGSVAASRAVYGQPLQPHYHYDKADVVVSLDSDFLGLDSPSPAVVNDFSKRRKVENPKDEMNRLYVVESQFSVTGAMADHRVRSKASDIEGFAAALARELGVLADLNVLSGASDKAQKALMAIVRDLKKSAGKSIVIAGPRQSVRAHALALMINQALGNVGATVTFTPALYEEQGDSFAQLVQDINAQRVNTILMLGGNPVFRATRGEKIYAAFEQIKNRVFLGFDNNETAAQSNWILPEAYYLEAWGDARASDGTASIQQPLIQPLHGGRSVLEVTAQLAGYKLRKGYDIVKDYWTAQWPAAERESRWRKSLHDGVIAGTQLQAVKPAYDAKKVSLPPAANKISGAEVVFVQSWSMYDGRFANNAWMQETPDPMTKVVWDNAALISPATAKKLGLVDGDMLKLTVGGRSMEAAALVQPGQADDSVTLPIGWGRVEVGRVGRGTGFNANIIRTTDNKHISPVEISKGTGTYQLVTTQEHHSMEGRPIVREAPIEEYRKEPEFAKEMVEAPDESIYGWWDYSKGNQWGMAIDLNACIGCNACLVACQSENNIPSVGKDQVSRGREMHWIRLDRYYSGDADDAEAVLQPLPCMQCENAPCESVCPVAATTHSPEGLNDMAYNRCVGTRYCLNNCPYKVRRFNFLNYHKEMPEMEHMASNPDVTVRMRGVMEKCTYCVQRIQEKKIQAKLEGHRELRDGEIQTACQQTCPADAIVFGNINDPESAVSKLKSQPRNYALLAEVNTRPRTTYLARLRNPNPELETPHAEVKHG